jgi:hypothetical protein
MQLDKQFVLEELRKTGLNQHVEKAVQELPEKRPGRHRLSGWARG